MPPEARLDPVLSQSPLPAGTPLPPAAGAVRAPQEETRAERWNHSLLWLLLLLVIVLAAWIYWGRLDVVSRASGTVIPEGQVKQIQHLEGGIVREILIQAGQRVVEGQPLILLESLRNETEVEELRTRIDGLQIRIARLEAEVGGVATLEYAESLRERQPRLVRESLELFKTRHERLSAQLRVQQRLTEQHQQRRAEVEARLAANQRVLGFLREQVGMSERLLEGNLSNRMNHLDLLKELSRIEGQMAEDRALLGQIDAALRETAEQQVLLRNQFREEAQDVLDEALHSLSMLEQRLRKEADGLARTVIRSPAEGTIKTLHVVTVGGVIPPGGLIADVVPTEDRLLILAQLPPGDIGYVEVGQVVKIRLASVDGFRYDPTDGRVEKISPDTLLNEQGMTYYQVHIVTEQPFFQRGAAVYPFFPGMLVECTILTGVRSVAQYLLEPILGEMNQALQER